ncbi:plastocyanin-like protein [Tanacetum coccineum]
MTSLDHIFVVLAILSIVLFPTTTKATDYVVGDASGWTLDFDYQAWASSKTFKVGDNLVFNYPKGVHNVFQVDGNAFAHCIIPPPSKAHTSGHDIIGLSSPGKAWAAQGVEKKKLSLFITCSIVQAKLARTLMNPGNDEIVKCYTEPDNPSKYGEDEFCKSGSGNCITRHDTEIQHVGSSNVDVNVKAKRRRRKISSFIVLDARIKPWFEATSRVIGTVMMHNVSSGRTIADASTHGSTSPAKTNLKVSMTAHCTQKSWVTRVAALKSHGLHWSQHSKGTGQNHLISIQLDTPSKLNLNGTRVVAFNYAVALKSHVVSHNRLPIQQSLFANLAINTNKEKALEEVCLAKTTPCKSAKALGMAPLSLLKLRMGKRISSGCTELVKPFESTNEGQDTSCEPSHLSIDNAPHQGVHKKFRYATNTKEIWNLASYEKVLVTFSETGQPKGNEANELKRFLMTLVRMPQHIGIDYPEWRKVPEDKKENLWKIITGKFAFESPNSEKKIKRRIMRDISHKWKSWKCELKKSSYDPSLTIDEIIASQTDKRVSLSKKLGVKFVDVVEEAIPGLNMSIVTSHINMEVDTISHIDIRNNSPTKFLRSLLQRHVLIQTIPRKGITRKNQGQDGDAKATLFNLEPTAEDLFNECLVEEESEVEVPVCKSIAIKKEDQDLHFMSCARKCNGQCLHSGHQSANQMAGWVVLAHGSSGRWVKWVMGQTSHRLEMGKKGLGENGLGYCLQTLDD